MLGGGCSEDILDKSPLDRLSPDNFYNNETEAKMALMGIYNTLTPNATPIHWYQFDFMSDNSYCHHSWQGSLEFGAWNQNSSSWAASAKWARAYEAIGRINTFLESIETSSVSEDVKTQMMAEARFIRAYNYADLIHYYGDVPLILKTLTLEESEVGRTPKSEVLSAVIDDFEYAEQNLPEEYSSDNVGRATKGAALAFKARTYLYNEMWQEAADAAQDVIDLDIYELYPDYAGLFKEGNENNVEVIFDIQYISDLQAQPWPSSALSFGEWPTPNVTTDLIDSYYMTNGLAIEDPGSGYDAQNPYQDRDPRLTASVVLPGSQMGAVTFVPANDQVPSGARPRKYADLDNADKNNCGINTILMRYADILLIRAEALIELGNTDQEVYDLINQVRQRQSVEMPAIKDAEGGGLSKARLMDILRHERRVEFFMEGTRYADMLRWKDENLVHDVFGYNTALLSNPDNSSEWAFEEIKIAERQFDSEKGWLWPIPQVEMQNNPNLTQNPGY